MEYLSIWSLSCVFSSSVPALCYMEGFFLELLVCMPTSSRSVQWSTCLSGLHRVTSFLPLFILGVFLGCHQVDLPFIHAPACWSFLSDVFFKSCYLVTLGSTSPEGSVYCSSWFAFIASLFKDKVYPLSISSFSAYFA